MAVVSCDNIGVGDEVKLATLNIKTDGTDSNSRSLTAALDKNEANYVEVLLSKGGTAKYYRAEGYFGPTLKISVPVDTYAATDVIMLIGRKSDKTLLAIGAPAAGFTVPTDDEIEFVVASLLSNISAYEIPGVSPDPNIPPDFAINEGSGVDGTTGDKIEDGLFVSLTGSGLFDGTNPCFQVPHDTTGIEASLTIRGFTTDTGANVYAIAPTNDVVIFTENSGNTSAITLGTVTPAANNAITDAGKISFTFDTPTLASNVAKRYFITFDLPVVGFVPTIKAAIEIDDGAGGTLDEYRTEWHIRGGTGDGQADFTGTDERQGVPLLVKNGINANSYFMAKPSW